MQNLHWKIILILTLVLMSVWSIASSGLRFGKDLAGGLSLVYEVDIHPDDNVDEIMKQTIEVVKNRLNPHGTVDLSVIRQGRNRLEIVAPLPSERVREAQAEVERLTGEILVETRISPTELRDALAAGTAVERWGEAERAEGVPSMAALQAAYDRVNTAQERYDDLRARLQEEDPDLIAAEQELAEAMVTYDEMFGEIISASLTEADLRRVLDMPTDPIERVDPETRRKVRDEARQVIIDPSPRAEAVEMLKARFPRIADRLDRLIERWDIYTGERRTFDDIEDIKRLMRGTGVLEFRIAVTPGTDDQGFNIDQMRRDLQERGPEVATSTLVRWFPINDVKQWYKTEQELEHLTFDPPSYFAQRRVVAEEYGGGYFLLLYDREGKKLTHEPGMPSWSLKAAGSTVDSLNRPAVRFDLDAPGGREMGRLTGPHVGEPMAIVLDGEVYSAPNLRSRIGDNGVIEGNFSRQEINYLIRVLASGSLAARLSPDPISVNRLGPSIGADNLKKGLEACLTAIIVVAIFMLAYYFFAGGVADLALLINGLLIFGVMSMQQASFTLPGIAGLVLTIGMAVDANVLIYERIREEFFAGETDLKAAIRLGYNKALSTIIDANVTNLIICLVLYQTATAEVKGFALVLGIGILATLFTSLFVTRAIFTIYTEVLKRDSLPMLATVYPVVHRTLEPNINWIGLRRIFQPISLAVIVIAVVMIYSRGVEMLDTEFRGGVSATMLTRHIDPQNPAEGRILLERADVEQRVRALADLAEHEDDPLRNFARAAVLTAGAAQEGGRSDSFQIKVTVQTDEAEDMRRVTGAIVAEFEDVLDAVPPSTFIGSQEALPPPGTTYPITRRFLNEVIERPVDPHNVQHFEGGVAVVLENLSPPVSLAEIDRRVARMRLQPEFSIAAIRQMEVLGLVRDAGTDRYRSAVVLVLDDRFRYGNNPEIWNDRVALVEWRLISEALSAEAPLEQIAEFSATIAETLAAGAVVAVVLSLAGILVYIWVRFGSFWYSLAAITALVHDVIIALGLLAATYYVAQTPIGALLAIDDFRIDLGVVAAMLTIIGYSLNDTIVILDRIRENRGKRPYATAEVINTSINQTVSRTVLTSFTTLTAVLIMYIFGGTGIRPFTFSLMMGILIGTYSSVAIAAPLVHRRRIGTPPEEESADLSTVITPDEGDGLTAATR